MTIVALIILFGLLLLIFELFMAPGTIVFGIIGFIVMIIGVIYTYSSFGVKTGNVILAGTLFTNALAFILAIKLLNGRKVGLQAVNDSKVNSIDDLIILEGDQGVSFGDLKPFGKAKINGQILEVSSQGDFIDDDTKIKVVEVSNNKIIVDILEN